MAGTKVKDQASTPPKKPLMARIVKSKVTGRWVYSMADLLEDPDVSAHFDRAAIWVEGARQLGKKTA